MTLLHCPPPHPSVLRVVVGRYTPSLCPTRRLWALRVVVWPYASSLDPIRCRRVLRIVVGALHVVSPGNSKRGRCRR
jgi:hypothetical protein